VSIACARLKTVRFAAIPPVSKAAHRSTNPGDDRQMRTANRRPEANSLIASRWTFDVVHFFRAGILRALRAS
jgi:hypothetical protein